MSTTLLPITNVILPTEDWVMRHFSFQPSQSAVSLSFQAFIIHRPSKSMAMVTSRGQGRPMKVEWDERRDSNAQSVKAEWERFVEECQHLASGQDGVLNLFATELARQKDLDRMFGTAVRSSDNEVKIYWEPLEALQGRVEGEYWNKKAKRWSPINA